MYKTTSICTCSYYSERDKNEFTQVVLLLSAPIPKSSSSSVTKAVDLELERPDSVYKFQVHAYTVCFSLSLRYFSELFVLW